MLRTLCRAAVGLLVVLFAAAVFSYSWTYTPIGRLDYPAAVIAKLASWQSGPPELTPDARRAANQRVAQMLSGLEEAPLARIEDREVVGPDGQRIPIRIYWPEALGRLPLYLDIHGGGWWMGDGFVFHAVTAHFDPLRDQGEAYALALEAAGVPVRLHREQALHGLVGSPGRAERVQAMAADAVRAALAR